MIKIKNNQQPMTNKLGGMNSMSLMHDGWGQNAIIGTFPTLQVSITPAIVVEYCILSPVMCGVIVSANETKYHN